MTITAVIAFLVGAVLAQRFRVFVLVPLLALLAFVTAVAILMASAGSWHFVLIAIAAAVGLQIGYLAGATFRAWDLLGNGQSKTPAPDKPKSSTGAVPVH